MHGDYDTKDMDRELGYIVSQLHKEKQRYNALHTAKVAGLILSSSIMIVVIMALIDLLFF